MITFDTLKRLTIPRGVAGNELPTSQIVLELLREYTADASIDCHGSVVGFIGNKNNGNPTILLDAHIDQVGLIVTGIDEKGFIKAEPCGGIDRRTLAAQSVTIHIARGVPIKGVVCTLPPHANASNGKEGEKAIKPTQIRINAGLTAEQARERISYGDTVSIDGELMELLNENVCCPGLDDRAGVCAILKALSLLEKKETMFNIAVSFSVQEELGCRGVAVTAYNFEPDCAIVVDVSHGVFPAITTRTNCGELGGGPMIGYAPALNRDMFERLKKIAHEHNIPYQLEIMDGDTGGTNADTVSTVKGGIKTALVSIPLRYMHTPVETVNLNDINAIGELIAAFVEERVKK